VNRLMTEFEQYLRERYRSPLTARGYGADARQFAAWLEQVNKAAFNLSAVTPSDIREYRQHLQSTERRRASTINRKLAAIAALMAWATSTGQVASDPTDGIRSARLVPSAPKWLDEREQLELQSAIEQDLRLAKLRYPKRIVTRRRDASLALFLLHTGLRLSEAVDLRLGDVEIGERRGSVLVRNGKGGKQRQVPLNSEARQAVRDWLAVRPQSDDHLWVGVECDSGDGMNGRSVQRMLRRYAQDAGLGDLSPHVLRHTFAKNLVNKGVGLEKVASLLGYSNLNTARIYFVTPGERDLEVAVETLES
jgi:site-specific recombinase XerD